MPSCDAETCLSRDALLKDGKNLSHVPPSTDIHLSDRKIYSPIIDWLVCRLEAILDFSSSMALIARDFSSRSEKKKQENLENFLFNSAQYNRKDVLPKTRVFLKRVADPD